MPFRNPWPHTCAIKITITAAEEGGESECLSSSLGVTDGRDGEQVKITRTVLARVAHLQVFIG